MRSAQIKGGVDAAAPCGGGEGADASLRRRLAAHASAAVVAAQERLQDLQLAQNALGDEGASALSAGLLRNQSLTKLSLGSNGIGAEGAASLSAALPGCAALQTLNLGDNSIGDAGAAFRAWAAAGVAFETRTARRARPCACGPSCCVGPTTQRRPACRRHGRGCAIACAPSTPRIRSRESRGIHRDARRAPAAAAARRSRSRSPRSALRGATTCARSRHEPPA